MSTHDARERIAIGDRQGMIAEFRGSTRQLVRMRRTFQKREIRLAPQFRVFHGILV
jgi:hypothetical protein